MNKNRIILNQNKNLKFLFKIKLKKFIINKHIDTRILNSYDDSDDDVLVLPFMIQKKQFRYIKRKKNPTGMKCGRRRSIIDEKKI